MAAAAAPSPTTPVPSPIPHALLRLSPPPAHAAALPVAATASAPPAAAAPSPKKLLRPLLLAARASCVQRPPVKEPSLTSLTRQQATMIPPNSSHVHRPRRPREQPPPQHGADDTGELRTAVHGEVLGEMPKRAQLCNFASTTYQPSNYSTVLLSQQLAHCRIDVPTSHPALHR